MHTNPQLCNAIFIGDSVLDVGHALGFYPKALIGGQVPLSEKDFPFIRHLECILCVMGPKRKLLLKAYKNIGIERVIIENSNSNPNPASIADALREDGLTVDILDFTQGMDSLFRQAGQIFDCPERAKRVAQKYATAHEDFHQTKKQLNKRIVVLLGLSRFRSDEHFLLLETPNSYLDHMVLGPLGCSNVGAPLMQEDAMVALDGIQNITTIKTLDNLAEAKPDIIALTGDASVGLAALYQATKQNPSLMDEVPALSEHAVFALPHCCSALPASLPYIQKEWANTLSGRSRLFQQQNTEEK